MTSSRIVSLFALLTLALSAGCPKDKKETTGPTCTDGVKNQDESAVDCGGATCPKCADGLACTTGTDCSSGYCDASNVCATQCKANTDACTAGTECCSTFCDATNHCATQCVANAGSCSTGTECCSGFCDATNHCATQCVANTGSCTAGAECCSGFCDATNHCATPCTANGSACPAAPGACCTGYCDGANCADSGGGCFNNGVACTVGTDCCSTFCDATNHCANPCKTDGNTCTASIECCSGLCDGTGHCATPCKVNTTSCASGAECCSTFCDATNHCANPCKVNTTACTAGTECCSGYCDGTNHCATPCKNNGSTCATDGECCDGNCDATNHCAPAVSSCQDGNTACTDNTQCCSLACGTGGLCTTDGFSGTPGDACANPSECYSLSCVGGVCTDTTCKATGTACGAGTECCTGLCSTTCQALPGGACKTLADSCTLPTDCCSTNCQGGKCVPAYICHAANDICYEDNDCCSGMCDATAPNPGRCILNPGGCNQDGNPCSGATNCCTRLCVDMGGGVTVCKPASGCRMTGDYCDRTEACCGGSPDAIKTGTDPYGVYCDTAGVNDFPPANDPSSKDEYRCSGGQACNPPGNICGAAGDPASQNCCAGKKAVCKRDSLGIARCFGGCPNDDCSTCPTGYDANDPNCCIPPGTGTANVCQFRDQCCNSLPCVPGDDGVLRCTERTCTAEHGACTGADDSSCCAGTVCTVDTGDLYPSDYTCEKPLICKDLGEQCSVASDCCSNYCSGEVCKPPCVPVEGTCTLDECCSGLTCEKANVTDPSGTCKPVSACAATGTACSDTKPCCNAPTEACISGICQVPPSCKAELASCVPTDTCCAGTPTPTCKESDGSACLTGSITCSCLSCSGDGGACTPGASPSDCCLGLECNSGTSTCAGCMTLGSGCTYNGGTDTCCSTLHCSDPFDGSTTNCATAGTCTCDICIPYGQSCTFSSSNCCGGGTCLDSGWNGCTEGSTDCTCKSNL